jgi:hypothetical protein
MSWLARLILAKLCRSADEKDRISWLARLIRALPVRPLSPADFFAEPKSELPDFCGVEKELGFSGVVGVGGG